MLRDGPGHNESAGVGSIEVRATAEIAREIGTVLGARGFDVPVTPPEDVRAIDGFDAVVLGSAVYAVVRARAAASRDLRRVPAGRQAAYAARGSSIDAGTISP